MPKGKIGSNNAHTSEIVVAKRGDEEHNTLYPETENKILDIADMITKGKTRETCLKYIMDTKGVGMQQAKIYYNSALHYLIPKDLDAYRKELIAKNFNRLEKIIEKGMTDDRDLRLAKDAIAEVNKMLGIGGNKVTVAKNAEGEELIQINFE